MCKICASIKKKIVFGFFQGVFRKIWTPALTTFLLIYCNNFLMWTSSMPEIWTLNWQLGFFVYTIKYCWSCSTQVPFVSGSKFSLVHQQLFGNQTFRASSVEGFWKTYSKPVSRVMNILFLLTISIDFQLGRW